MLEDLLIEILLRSSVKSLLRAKCVCKHWYRLIKSRSFEYRYLEYQKNMNQSRLLIKYFNDGVRYTVLDDIAQSNGRHLALGYLPFDTHGLEGPVDGLYCMHNINGLIVLWNPALRGFKVLPSPPPHFLPHYGVDGCSIGFGIDPLTREHKVVLFRYSSDVKAYFPANENPIVTLYRLTTNTWRLLDLGDLGLCNFTVGCGSSFINGIYHWCVARDVLAFDMGKETFRVIPGPNISDDLRYWFCSIAVYEDHVAVVRYNAEFVHVWLMLKEGIWIKQFSIGPTLGIVSPIGFWKKGVFLAVEDIDQYPRNHDSRLVFYNVDTQEMRNVGPRATWYDQACVYYESLVSFG